MTSSDTRLMLEKMKKDFNTVHFHKTTAVEITKIDKKEVIVRIRTDERHMNFHGFTHGGVLATLLDAATGISVYPHLKSNETAITISLNIDYIAPAAIQEEFTALGTMVYRSKRLARTQAVIRDTDDNIIAIGSSSLMIIQKESGENPHTRGK